MTTNAHTLARVERLLRRRGAEPLTPAEREMLEDLMVSGYCPDSYLLDAVSVARWASHG